MRKNTMGFLALAAAMMASSAMANGDGGYTYYQEQGMYAAETPTPIKSTKTMAVAPVAKAVKAVKATKPSKAVKVGQSTPVEAETAAITVAGSDGGYTYL